MVPWHSPFLALTITPFFSSARLQSAKRPLLRPWIFLARRLATHWLRVAIFGAKGCSYSWRGTTSCEHEPKTKHFEVRASGSFISTKSIVDVLPLKQLRFKLDKCCLNGPSSTSVIDVFLLITMQYLSRDLIDGRDSNFEPQYDRYYLNNGPRLTRLKALSLLPPPKKSW